MRRRACCQAIGAAGAATVDGMLAVLAVRSVHAALPLVGFVHSGCTAAPMFAIAVFHQLCQLHILCASAVPCTLVSQVQLL